MWMNGLNCMQVKYFWFLILLYDIKPLCDGVLSFPCISALQEWALAAIEPRFNEPYKRCWDCHTINKVFNVLSLLIQGLA